MKAVRIATFFAAAAVVAFSCSAAWAADESPRGPAAGAASEMEQALERAAKAAAAGIGRGLQAAEHGVRTGAAAAARGIERAARATARAADQAAKKLERALPPAAPPGSERTGSEQARSGRTDT